MTSQPTREQHPARAGDAGGGARRARAPQDGDIYVDGTFGAGGYTRAFSNGRRRRVYAIDRDPDAHPRRQGAAWWIFGGSPDAARRRASADMERSLAAAGVERVDGVVLDIGVSSMQIDEAERGFSFTKDGPLDMRMSRPRARAPPTSSTARPMRRSDAASSACSARSTMRAPSPAPSRRRAAKPPILTTAGWRAIVDEGHRRQAQGPHPSGDPHLPGLAHPCEPRTRRTGGGPRRGRATAGARRTTRGRDLPFARRPDRQALSRGQRPGRPADRRAMRRGRAGAEPSFTLLFKGHREASAAEIARKSARAFGETAGGRSAPRPPGSPLDEEALGVIAHS